MNNMRKLLTATTIASIVLTGCGGGGISTSSTSSPTTSEVTGGVYASLVEGARACIEDSSKNIIASNGTELCSTTCSDGTFTIQIPQGINLSNNDWVGLYVVDQNGNDFKVADVPITQVEVNNSTNVLSITPKAIACGNETLANEIGAVIHAIGGDLDGNATIVDLSNVDIEDIGVQTPDNQTESITYLSTPLIDLIKEKEIIIIESYHNLLNQKYRIEVNPNNLQAPIVIYNGTRPQQVVYNWEAHKQEIEGNLQALQALSSGNVQQFENDRLISLINTLKTKLQIIVSSGTLSSDEANQANSVISDLTNVVNDLTSSGITENTESEVQNAISEVNSLIKTFNSFGLRTFGLQQLTNSISSVLEENLQQGNYTS